MRLLVVEFKSDNAIKLNAMKFIVKKIVRLKVTMETYCGSCKKCRKTKKK